MINLHSSQIWNSHLGSSSPNQSSSRKSNRRASLLPRSRLAFSLFSTVHNVPTTRTLAQRYPRANPCPTKNLGPSVLLYSCVPSTAPKLPIEICIALHWPSLVSSTRYHCSPARIEQWLSRDRYQMLQGWSRNS